MSSEGTGKGICVGRSANSPSRKILQMTEVRKFEYNIFGLSSDEVRIQLASVRPPGFSSGILRIRGVLQSEFQMLIVDSLDTQWIISKAGLTGCHWRYLTGE